MAFARLLLKYNTSGFHYYYDGTAHNGYHEVCPTGKYRCFYWDPKNIARLEEMQGDASQKQLAISEIDPATRQNAFHVVFSNRLPKPPIQSKDFYISTAIQHHLPDTIRITDDYSYSLDSPGLATYTAQHRKFLEKNHLMKHDVNYRREIMNGLVDFLLEPFKNNDPALVNALIQKDKKGNTSFFYAIDNDSDDYDICPLLARLKKLTLEQKKNLYLQTNENGKTILHHILLHCVGFTLQADCFGHDLVRDALCQPDKKGNTPLHDFFLLRKSNSLKMLREIGELINPKQDLPVPPVEHKHDDYLPGNKEGANPLHFLCQRAPLDENLEMLKEMLLIAGGSKTEKIMQKDTFDMTPVHYAIKAGNFSLAAEMLNQLTTEKKIEMILMKHNQHETLLHYICQHGNQDLLDQAILIIGPKECYKIRTQLPLKVSSTNKNLTQEQLVSTVGKYSKLFDAFDYFVKKYNEKSVTHQTTDSDFYTHQSEDFNARFKDFCGCLPAIYFGCELPPGSRSFYSNTINLGVVILTGSETYHKLRDRFNDVLPVELLDFKTFMNEDTSKVGLEIRGKLKALQAPEQAEEKQAAKKYLPRDLNGANYLHGFCRGTYKDNTVASLKEKIGHIPRDYVASKILEVDRSGKTPVHYAIQSRRYDLMKELLTYLNSAQQKHVMSIKHNVKGETALHLICQFGNKDWLEWAIQGIGPRALYDIRHELPLTGDTSNLQLCQQDIYETIKNYNRLFDTFHYLVNKFKMNVQLENQPEFKKRFNDFCQCFNSLQKNTKWQESTEFCAKKVGFGIFSTEVGGTYHDLRFSLKWATKEEREEFGAFLSEISTHQDWKTKPASMVAKMIVEELDKLNPKPDAQVTIHAIPPLGAAPIDGGFVVVQPVVPVASAPDLNLIDNGSSSNVSAPPAPPGGPTVRNGSLGR